MRSTLLNPSPWWRQWLVLMLFTAAWPCEAQNKDPYAPKPEIPPGYTLVGGDILVPAIQPQSPFSPNPDNYWPGGTVYYEFDSNVSATNQTAMLAAMADWEAVAAVQFVPRNGQSDYAHIENSTGNNSQVGHVGGEQYINIYNWNMEFVMAHELGHCLGFGHTQGRPDRSLYVSIIYSNIQPAYASQFDIYAGFTDYGPYDFDSVMEYGQCDFSIDCAAGATCACSNIVIQVLPPNDTYWQSRLGQRTHLSTMDKLIMSFLYPQSNWRFVDLNSTASPESGTFLLPYTTIAQGTNGVPSGGTLWIQPGTYSAIGTYTRAMTLKAPLGGVTLSE